MDDRFQSAPCGIISFTDDGTIAAINDFLLDLLEYGKGELDGRRFESILSVPGRIFYQTHLFPLLKLHSKADEIYLQLRSKSGSTVPVLLNAVREEQHSGGAVSTCAVIPMHQRSEYEDVILRAKRTAEEATSAKDEFLAAVSHDLRSPLTAILGWTRMLSTGQLDTETTVRALETIERSARSQVQLIEDIMDSSRINSGKLRLDVKRTFPVDVINAALDIVHPAAEAKQVRIQPVLDPAAGPVAGDPDRLQQVMWNLLTNAVKFTPKGGRVQIRLERVNSHVEISVSDTGRGIDPEFLPYVFERFRQASGSGSRHGGLGLGMTITRHLVELHGGTIRAESEGEGKGATFTVELPLMIMQTAAVEPFPAVDGEIGRLPKLDGLHILVVDDEPDAREVVSTVLRRAGAKVTSVETVAAAIEHLLRLKPDVLVSDVDLPGEDGYSLIRAVRRLESADMRSIPAIALTAKARFADRMSALSAGYHMHIPKPVEPAELITLISNVSRSPSVR